jgi:hypothetical protein
MSECVCRKCGATIEEDMVLVNRPYFLNQCNENAALKEEIKALNTLIDILENQLEEARKNH